MSAYSTVDDRDRALKLIELRAHDNRGAAGVLEAIRDEHEMAGLLHATLELFVSIKLQLRNELSAALVDVALQEIAADDRNADHRLAADLIVAHEQTQDDLGDNVFRDFGVEDFNRGIDRIGDRFRETVMAVVDVWLTLLPELRTEAAGIRLLDRHTE